MEPGLIKVEGKSKPGVSKALDKGNTQHRFDYDGKNGKDYGAKRPARASYTAQDQITKK